MWVPCHSSFCDFHFKESQYAWSGERVKFLSLPTAWSIKAGWTWNFSKAGLLTISLRMLLVVNHYYRFTGWLKFPSPSWFDTICKRAHFVFHPSQLTRVSLLMPVFSSHWSRTGRLPAMGMFKHILVKLLQSTTSQSCYTKHGIRPCQQSFVPVSDAVVCIPLIHKPLIVISALRILKLLKHNPIMKIQYRNQKWSHVWRMEMKIPLQSFWLSENNFFRPGSKKDKINGFWVCWLEISHPDNVPADMHACPCSRIFCRSEWR